MRSIIESIYPEKERKLFTDRDIELALLDRNTQRILDGSGENICFIGLRRVGKSLTLKQYISKLDNDQVFAVYMDFERLDTTPEFFAVQYAGQILRWFMNDENLAPYLDIATLVKKIADIKSEIARNTIYAFFDELNKARPNQRLMLELAFDFPEKFAREQNINIVLFLDEFQRLKEIDNFPQIRDVLGLFRSVLQTQSKTNYVVAGSAIRMLERIFQEADSPLFAQFRVERVSFFEKKASFELASKITGSQNPGVMGMIYKLSSGHPYYIYSICQRMNEIGEINVNGARKAFALEALLRNGSINLMCKYVFESSMSRVRGEALLKTIIRVLAKEDGRKISEISRAIKRKEGTTRNMLERLCDIDLIVKEDKLYYFRDPVLRYWIMNVYEGVEFDALPGKKVLEDMVRDIEEKFEKTSTELGIAKEYELKYSLEKYLEMHLDKYLKDKIEFDLVGIKENMDYIFEIKWRMKETGYKDIEKFLAKVARSEFAGKLKRLIFISKRGFTEQAAQYAKGENIVLIKERDIPEIKRLMIENKIRNN
ncbi:MAG: AAA family ATPase [Candidatus Methanoperedenaceae archaeon]|nr:AAA family ATPase [Candidatus Methanoperedenaceae archaeon]